MVYKVLNGLAPEYISDKFAKVSESQIDNDLLQVLSSRTSYYENRLQYYQLSYEMNYHLTFTIFLF